MLFIAADAGVGTYPGQSYARVDILTNGQVQIIYKVQAGIWLSLDGISFVGLPD
jgi:hypothetical protein